MLEGTLPTSTPVTLVTGYLGAGKTTWLNQRLRDGVAPGTLVLVNDFGTINIDAELIEHEGERLLKLSSGCLCCSLSDELGTQLSRIGRWPDPPAALIIETSGIARPRRIADMIRVARRFRLERIVTLIDLASLGQRLADDRVAELVSGQIGSADVLSCNRSERLVHDERESWRDRLRELNPVAHIEGIDVGTASSVSSNSQRPFSSRQASNPAMTQQPVIKDSDPEWQRFAIALSPSLARRDLETLLARHVNGLARAKGFLQVDGRHYVFQWSGGHADWTPTTPRPGGGQLVGIGFKGEVFDGLLKALKALA